MKREIWENLRLSEYHRSIINEILINHIKFYQLVPETRLIPIKRGTSISNCRYWSPRSQNPRLKHQILLHCSRVIVWWALFTNGITRHGFFENARVQASTVPILLACGAKYEAPFRTVQIDRRHLDEIIFKKVNPQ